MSLSDNLHIIGLTGQSGAGKSTVSKILSENGLPVIDADAVSRDVSCDEHFLSEAAAVYPDCVNAFGLDRRRLASVVFNDRNKLKEYTAIIYPYITKRVFDKMLSLKNEGSSIIVLDAPTLFESGLNDICSLVVSVIAPMELKLKRILERDSIPVEAVYSRLSSQNTEQFFKSHSDYVINNSSDIAELESKVRNIIGRIKEQLDG